MTLEYDDPCPGCGEQGVLRREVAARVPNCYVCTCDDCPVIEYDRDGSVHHEADTPAMKCEVLVDRGYR